MNKLYVKDGTLVKEFNDVASVIKFLEQILEVKYNTNRMTWMQTAIELGHGYDDTAGETFVESFADKLEIGVVRGDKYVRCNIHEATKFQGSEYGD